MEKECTLERMNCFHHDNDHWKTAPQWTAGPFCFCMNANNNTYSCVRTINSTHNFLYCEFTTGFVTYYNLRIGEYQLMSSRPGYDMAPKYHHHFVIAIVIFQTALYSLIMYEIITTVKGGIGYKMGRKETKILY